MKKIILIIAMCITSLLSSCGSGERSMENDTWDKAELPAPPEVKLEDVDFRTLGMDSESFSRIFRTCPLQNPNMIQSNSNDK